MDPSVPGAAQQSARGPGKLLLPQGGPGPGRGRGSTATRETRLGTGPAAAPGSGSSAATRRGPTLAPHVCTGQTTPHITREALRPRQGHELPKYPRVGQMEPGGLSRGLRERPSSHTCTHRHTHVRAPGEQFCVTFRGVAERSQPLISWWPARRVTPGCLGTWVLIPPTRHAGTGRRARLESRLQATPVWAPPSAPGPPSRQHWASSHAVRSLCPSVPPCPIWKGGLVMMPACNPSGLCLAQSPPPGPDPRADSPAGGDSGRRMSTGNVSQEDAWEQEGLSGHDAMGGGTQKAGRAPHMVLLTDDHSCKPPRPRAHLADAETEAQREKLRAGIRPPVRLPPRWGPPRAPAGQRSRLPWHPDHPPTPAAGRVGGRWWSPLEETGDWIRGGGQSGREDKGKGNPRPRSSRHSLCERRQLITLLHLMG